MTPIAILEPVSVGGVMVKQASLGNVKLAMVRLTPFSLSNIAVDQLKVRKP